MGTTAIHTPLFLQPAIGDAAIDYSGQEFRQYVRAQLTPVSGVGGEQGVTSASSFNVTQRGAGANLSVDVASGLAYVVGDDVSNQGTYQVWNDATANVTGWTVPGSGTYHHRLVLQVQDKLSNGAYTGYIAKLVPVLDTGGGLPAEPASAVTLATIDIASGSSSILNANINDYRPRIGQVAVFKTADTARTHATALTNDPDLQLLNLQASATYEILGVLFYTGGSGGAEGDFAWQFTLSGGSSGTYADPHLSPAGNYGGFGSSAWGTSHGAQTTGTGNLQDVTIIGTYVTGAAPASLVLQWAQNSDSGTATTLKANSFLRARRLG